MSVWLKRYVTGLGDVPIASLGDSGPLPFGVTMIDLTFQGFLGSIFLHDHVSGPRKVSELAYSLCN